jgi:hypothetical protein
MKTLKFVSRLVQPILSGEKTSTWRLFDDKDLSLGDELSFVNRETLQEFARGKILAIKEKSLGEATEADFVGNENYGSLENMYKILRGHYGDKVNPEIIVKMIDFEIV